MLSFPLLGIIAGIGLILAIFAPFYLLLCWDLLLSIFQGFWTLGGTRIDYTDVIVGCLGFAIVLRGRFDRQGTKIPYLVPWLLLGIFLSLAYLVAPQNQRNLTDPVRIGYQLYRYCWKPLLYYPLAMVFLRDASKIRIAFFTMVVGFDLCAFNAIQQGFQGYSAAPGPFGHGNAFASILVTPFILCFASVLYSRSVGEQIFCGISMLVMFVDLMTAGLIQGFQWRDLAPWEDSLTASRPFWILRTISGTGMLIGMFLFCYNVWMTARHRTSPMTETQPVGPEPALT